MPYIRKDTEMRLWQEQLNNSIILICNSLFNMNFLSTISAVRITAKLCSNFSFSTMFFGFSLTLQKKLSMNSGIEQSTLLFEIIERRLEYLSLIFFTCKTLRYFSVTNINFLYNFKGGASFYSLSDHTLYGFS